MTEGAPALPWPIAPAVPGTVSTPEGLSDEHRAIAGAAAEFWRKDVAPALPALHRQERGVARRLLHAAADLGLTAIDVPEALGGLGLDQAAFVASIEALSADQSYIGWHLGQCGIGMLPLLWYGSPAQQQRYLPGLLKAETVAAYALTEPQAGSDALAIRTRADVSADGTHYRLTGQKAWITNGAEADLFTVFAKVGGEAFTALLVERAFGVVHGPEEHKMGLAGTSTTAVYLEDVWVPRDNVLGGVGRGHEVAFTVLNAGRLHMGPVALGAAKRILAISLAHAGSRHAFGAPLSTFGAIREKVADAVARIFAVESMVWRVVGQIDAARRAPAADEAGGGLRAAFARHHPECAIVKIAASEMLGDVADHGVQIHGGYGFHRDCEAERAYRDARVTRIFEGTNEINRLLVARAILTRLTDTEVMGLARRAPVAFAQAPLAETTFLARTRRAVLVSLALAERAAGPRLRDAQEIALRLADLLVDLCMLESVVARANTAFARDEAVHAVAARLAHEASWRMARTTREIACATTAATERPALLDALARLTAPEAADTIDGQRTIAARAIAAARYPC